jgi:hypothetical protein
MNRYRIFQDAFHKCVVLFVAIALHASAAFAQSSVPRVEIGPTFTCFTGCADLGNKGYGARITVNLLDSIGVEYQFTRLEKADPDLRHPVYGSGHVRFSRRFEKRLKFNFFALAGPGFFNQHRSVGKLPGPSATRHFRRFAFNAGGGVEIVPIRRASVRFDITDLISHTVCFNFACDQVGYENNPDFKVGIMLRFP